MSTASPPAATSNPGPLASDPPHRRQREHPSGFYVLCAVELFERFAGTLLGSLVLLYLSERLGMTTGSATRLGGTFNAAIYVSSVIGGVIADRWLGTRRSILLGALLLALGYAVLSMDRATLLDLAEGVSTDPFQFFQVLIDLQKAGIISAVNLILRYQPPNGESAVRTLLAENLSDGEFAFLSRMALIDLLHEDDCLFILDEPETHFNDDWKRNLVDSIERSVMGTTSEVILTSHASITLTDAYPDEVILLSHEGQENVPLTFGAEQGELLRRVYGAERSVGKRAIRIIEAALKNNTDQELEQLLDQVGPGNYRFKIVRELERRAASDQQT